MHPGSLVESSEFHDPSPALLSCHREVVERQVEGVRAALRLQINRSLGSKSDRPRPGTRRPNAIHSADLSCWATGQRSMMICSRQVLDPAKGKGQHPRRRRPMHQSLG